jgi:dodecin
MTAQREDADEPLDEDAHTLTDSGASEFSRRSGGVPRGEPIPEQFAERDRNLETEHAQNPDELGFAYLKRATQDEPVGERPEHEQPHRDPDRASNGERYTRQQVPGAEITRERLITSLPNDDAHRHETRIYELDEEVEQEESLMSVAKVTEITAESTESFDAAIRDGIAAASRSIENIRNVWIKDQQVIVKNNKPERYRVDMKVTFVLNDR